MASYAAIALAAVAGTVRWSLICAVIMAVGYIGGLILHGYTWHRLEQLHDADSVIANAGGYLLAGYFLAAPVAWLGGYVARINQVIERRPQPKRLRTRHLSPREVQVAQLVAAGLSNDAIASELTLGSRTVQSHVANALKKTRTGTRTALAVVAVQEGLIPEPARPQTNTATANAAPAVTADSHPATADIGPQV